MTTIQERCDTASCRICGRAGLSPVLDLGNTPLADALLTREQLERGDEPSFPLQVAFCPDCSLVQILETVDPTLLFATDYPYFSSFSPALLEHSRKNALELIEMRSLGPKSLVIELASNDGYLLKNFVDRAVPVLGIDPAEGPVSAARNAGVESICDFFTEDLARRLAAEGKRADVVIANNVLAHVADTNGFVRGVRTILKDGGVAVIEAPYVRELIEHCEFDTIYHEHLCYFSVTALDRLFRRNGLFLNDVRELPIHGGSLRLYVEKTEARSAHVTKMLEGERGAGMTSASYYRSFSARVEKLRADLRTTLESLRKQGARVAAYGAAAKGATLLNYMGINSGALEFVVDRNTHKQGKFMPGAHLPILPPSALLEKAPDYTLMLAWNFADEILAQQADYRRRGGRFIVPVPTVRIV